MSVRISFINYTTNWAEDEINERANRLKKGNRTRNIERMKLSRTTQEGQLLPLVNQECKPTPFSKLGANFDLQIHTLLIPCETLETVKNLRRQYTYSEMKKNTAYQCPQSRWIGSPTKHCRRHCQTQTKRVEPRNGQPENRIMRESRICYPHSFTFFLNSCNRKPNSSLRKLRQLLNASMSCFRYRRWMNGLVKSR